MSASEQLLFLFFFSKMCLNEFLASLCFCMGPGKFQQACYLTLSQQKNLITTFSFFR